MGITLDQRERRVLLPGGIWAMMSQTQWRRWQREQAHIREVELNQSSPKREVSNDGLIRL